MFALATKTSVEPALAATDHCYLARQPIFDSEREVFAYELLYRSSLVDKATFLDADIATCELISHTFLSADFEGISNGKPVFINLPRRFITGELPMPLDPRSVVLEILEDVFADAPALAGATKLAQQGYTLALDDFVEADNNREFIRLARYIKVDVLNLNDSEVRRQTTSLMRHQIPLLAEKVETWERFQLCKELGYQYFQGYCFCRPTVVAGRELNASRTAMLDMFAKLQNPTCTIADLERIVGNDLALYYKILKIINSSYYSLGKTVESIQQAVILLGLDTLKKWLTLIFMSASPGKPAELIALALLRARQCELAAAKLRLPTDAAFAVGMFSLLDAVMDRPLPELLAQLPLSKEIKRALMERNGELGKLLEATVAFQQGEWAQVRKCGIAGTLLRESYEQAIQWSANIKTNLGL